MIMLCYANINQYIGETKKISIVKYDYIKYWRSVHLTKPNIIMDCLYHFVNSIDKIKSILSDKFYGSYCKETYHFKGEELNLYVPTICFSDLPGSTIEKFSVYGRYAFGLKKDWGFGERIDLNRMTQTFGMYGLESKSVMKIGKKLQMNGGRVITAWTITKTVKTVTSIVYN